MRAAPSFAAALCLLAGCTSGYPDALGYDDEPLSFDGQRLLGVGLDGPSRVLYRVVPRDDITTLDTCLLREPDVKGWRSDPSGAIDCDLGSAGADGDHVLSAGQYVLALYCRPDYVEGDCHVDVTVLATPR